MKYKVYCRTWSDDSGEYIIMPETIPFDKWKSISINDDHRYCVAKVSYAANNAAEMRQHANKLAAYFEEVDTAKEAVIRCTKI